MKVIVVDDKEENRYLLKAMFEGNGDEVVTAANGQEALDILQSQKINLIISDCLMPVMDGFVLCRRCKTEEKLKNIPFVFCTASYPEKKDEEFALELGAAEYIIKPFDPPVFLRTIKEVMERAKKGQVSKLKPTLAENSLFKLYNERLVYKLDQKVAELEAEIARRKKAEDNTNRLMNILLTIRQINQFIVEIEDENELLQKTCSALADGRSYKLARIGFIQEGNYDIQPVAQAGFALDYLKSLKVTWDDSEYGSNPSGMAIKTGKPVIVQDVDKDESYRFWRDIASKYGFAGVAALPLLVQDKIIGMLAVYSDKMDVFNEEEIGLLKELAGDISLGLTKIRQRLETARTEAKYAALVDSSNDGIIILQDSLVKFSSKHMDRMTGFSPEEYLNKPFLDFIAPQYRELVIERYKKRLSGQEVPNRYEIEILAKGNKSISVELNVSVTGYEGRPAEMAIIRDITERKLAEEALHKSEENFRTSMDNSPVGILIATQEAKELYANKAFFNDIYGYNSLEELLSVSLEERLAPESFAFFKARMDKVKQKGFIPFQHEIRVIRKDGEVRYLLLSVAEVLWDGNPQIQMVYQDITERQQAEEALRTNEQKLREAQALGKIANFEVNKPPNFEVRWSDEMYELFERDRRLPPPTVEEIPGYFSPEEYSKFTSISNRAVSEGIEVHQDVTANLPSGKKPVFSVTMRPIKDNQGEIIKMFGTIQDITERKQAERDLEFQSNIVAVVDEGIVVNDTELNIVYFNDYWARLLGYTRDELSGLTFNDIVAPEISPRVISEIRNAVDLKSDIVFESIYLRKDKTRVPVEIRTKMVYLNDQKLAIHSIRDITERKKAEQQRIESYEKLQQTFDGVIKVMSAMIELRDPYTAGHQLRVAQLARAIAGEMYLTKEQADQIYTAALIHDIGKISVPAEILSKPGTLNPIELSLIQMHSKAGYDILKNIEFPYPVARWVLEHHERVNGSGYPNKLQKDQISLEARILAVADVVEGISSYRPYRPGLGISVALEEITKKKDILYDNDVVSACCRLFYEKGFKL